jgi:hypothetical protein
MGQLLEETLPLSALPGTNFHGTWYHTYLLIFDTVGRSVVLSSSPSAHSATINKKALQATLFVGGEDDMRKPTLCRGAVVVVTINPSKWYV